MTREIVGQLQSTMTSEVGSVIFTEVVLIFEISNPDGTGTQEVQMLANLTCRSTSAQAAVEDMLEAIDGVRVRPATHKLVNLGQAAKQPAAAGAPAAKAQAPAPEKPAAPAAPAGSGKGKYNNNPVSPDAPGGVNSKYRLLLASKMVVTPTADQKVKVQFFDDNPNHRYPELSAAWSYERARNLLASTGDDWTDKTLSVAGSYQVEYRVWWTESEKLSSSGRPYKDVVKVEHQSSPMPTSERPH